MCFAVRYSFLLFCSKANVFRCCEVKANVFRLIFRLVASLGLASECVSLFVIVFCCFVVKRMCFAVRYSFFFVVL